MIRRRLGRTRGRRSPTHGWLGRTHGWLGRLARIRPGWRRWRHWPLRHRMVVTIAALAAVALVVADFAGAALLRSYLTGRLDAQLHAQSRAVARVTRFPGQVPRGLRPGPPFGGDSRTFVYS